jgi:hypothetical protein
VSASSKPLKAALAEPELVIMRVFNAPRDVVWKAWTDPKYAVQWWGPKDYPATHLEMDVRPGGIWRGRLRSTEDGRELSHKGDTAAYLDRLMQRPSFTRVLEEAQPYFAMIPK